MLGPNVSEKERNAPPGDLPPHDAEHPTGSQDLFTGSLTKQFPAVVPGQNDFEDPLSLDVAQWLTAFVKAGKGIRVYEARVLAHGRATPFQPVLELFRDIFGMRAKEAPDVSRRRVIEVVPAWFCSPVTVKAYCQIATIAVTTPMRSFSSSSVAPCSICASKNPA